VHKHHDKNEQPREGEEEIHAPVDDGAGRRHDPDEREYEADGCDDDGVDEDAEDGEGVLG